METDCTLEKFEFQAPGRRIAVAAFDGGRITSDGGVLLLREADQGRGLIERFASCFQDFRNPDAIEHSVEELVRQRVYGLALGYEDLNDHDTLRSDALLAACVGKEDPTGESRRRESDQGKALAGKSTLNRLEWGATEEAAGDRYRRIAVDDEAVDSFLVDVFLERHDAPPDQIVLDFDASDDPLHGNQEGRFFHGYYDCYCYLPLYVICGNDVVCARLRRSNIDASHGSVEELERIVGQIRKHWPEVQILVRGDSAFAREALMHWCEGHEVDYVFGLAKNSRLEAALAPTFERTEALCAEQGAPQRVYAEFSYKTRTSWSRERRVIGKAQITTTGRNPRFIVTSLDAATADAQALYEKVYCARGDIENRIKQQQLDLFATRTSGHLMRVNQLRLWFSTVAYLLLDELRRVGLEGSEMAHAYVGTIRTKLLKIGARVRVTVRRIWVSFTSSCPYEALFAYACHRLQRAGPAIA